jgi:hypothetical protein
MRFKFVAVIVLATLGIVAGLSPLDARTRVDRNHKHRASDAYSASARQQLQPVARPVYDDPNPYYDRWPHGGAGP